MGLNSRFLFLVAPQSESAAIQSGRCYLNGEAPTLRPGLDTVASNDNTRESHQCCHHKESSGKRSDSPRVGPPPSWPLHWWDVVEEAVPVHRLPAPRPNHRRLRPPPRKSRGACGTTTSRWTPSTARKSRRSTASCPCSHRPTAKRPRGRTAHSS